MWWIICIFLFLPGSVISRPRCGGVYTAARGIIQSPNFPNKFPVPIHCEWIIDAQHIGSVNSSIIIYFTQLFVFEGLTFKEYQIYDQTYQLNGKDIHTVTENNVTKVSYISSKQDYLVITLKLESIESTHLRVLDHLLDVYGFNITYEITAGLPRADRCTMMDCGFTGTCYDNYTHFTCSCFPGYEGRTCSDGPNSLCTQQKCQNGGTCLHMGDSAVRCECNPGFTGEYCESRVTPPAKDCERCFVSCAFNGEDSNICKCPEGTNATFAENIIGFSVDMKLTNIPYQKLAQQKLYIENQITKSLKESAPTIGDVRVVDVESYPSHVELTLLMSGTRKDERRLKSVISKWSERGHIGNLTLAPQQSFSLLYQNSFYQQSISIQPSGLIHAGEDFTLSCTTQGTSPSFRWFKDGLFVNVTAPTSNKQIKIKEDQDVKDQYTSLLGIKNASPFDQGTFTCQIVENGAQKCLSKKVDIRTPPRVWIEPMSLTVRKGENFTIKCFSASSNSHKSKYTYSWTKNKELLPIKTETEHYEILYPMGSILQVSSINKSTYFSCLVQDSAVWAEQSILVNVIDTELVKTCMGERHLKLLWPETAPGSDSLQECPNGYYGVARRACTLRNTGQPTWYLPDYSGCIISKLSDLDNERLRLGYLSRNPIAILGGYKKYVQESKMSLLPGEGSRILNLVHEVISFMNNSIIEDSGNTILDIADQILLQKYSLINQTQIILLQQLVKQQSLQFPPNFHRTLSTIDITLRMADKTGFHVPVSLESYPQWYSYKLHLALPQHYFAPPNKSATLAVVVYRNLSAFLPQRAAIRLKDGIEMDYEIISNIVASSLLFNGVEITRNLSDAIFTMEFNHPSKNSSQDSWKILCGIADYASYGYSWDTQTCTTRLLDGFRTRCLCSRAGTYAILLTMKPSFVVNETVAVKQIVILISCSISMLLTATTGLILSIYWFCRRSCLVFLKLQCCLSMFGAMVVFIYALWDDVSNDLFLTVMSFLQSFLLTGLSSQLSNLLIIYSELVQMPRIKSIKQTVILIITGAPMIGVFGNHMAHLTMNTRIDSWWLIYGSLSFNIFIISFFILIILYFVLFYIVLNKLIKVNIKYEKSSEPLQIRRRLLRRSALVFCSITSTVFSSILYINFVDNIFYHYIFSIISIVMGTVVFICYIVSSETPITLKLITKLKDKKQCEKESPDSSKQLKFFTKQKAEIENESNPYFCKNSAETHFMYDPLCKQKLSEIGSTSFKTYASANFIDNQDSMPHSSQHDLQLYDSSPKQFQREIINSPDLLGNKKFVELDLVASSIQKPTEQTPFYEISTVKCKPILTKVSPPTITITKVEAVEDKLERQRPEGEENLPHVEVVPVISISEQNKSSEEHTVKLDDNLDAVMDSITHDLDYLLNDNEFEAESNVPAVNVNTLRRISRPPSLSVFEQIAEETEEDVKVPEAITNVSRTNC